MEGSLAKMIVGRQLPVGYLRRNARAGDPNELLLPRYSDSFEIEVH
jgi:hypothetical protein